jgi:hypothetical protein
MCGPSHPVPVTPDLARALGLYRDLLDGAAVSRLRAAGVTGVQDPDGNTVVIGQAAAGS